MRRRDSERSLIPSLFIAQRKGAAGVEAVTRVGLEQSSLCGGRYCNAWPQLLRFGLLPITLFFPSDCRRADLAKLALVGSVVVLFFLFTAKCVFPGGAIQFMQYADAILHGTTLKPDIAQRDAGYPLLIILSGYPFLHSLIPLLLIQAAFAIAMPLLIYEALRRLSANTAFYTALASIVLLFPIYFMKMIHHDQMYVFLSILMLCMLLMFVQTTKIRFLYYFTFAALAASIARPAGNALFPVFLFVSYISVRGSIRHYIACFALFGLFVAGYSWHRYVIFDVRHAGELPSYTGEQIFFDPYLNTANYGIRLLPKRVGPNLELIVENLRRLLQPSVTGSEFVQQQIAPLYAHSGEPKEFADANIFPFSPDQLIERIFTKPNYEYYLILCAAADDRVLLHAAFEIARAYPGLIVRYFMRNLLHFIFDPGYKHSRYDSDMLPWRAEGVAFFPAKNDLLGVEEGFSGRPAREVTFDPLSRQRGIVILMFNTIGKGWPKLYPYEVRITSVLMCAAWISTGIALLHFLGGARGTAVSDKRKGLQFTRGLIPSITIASLLFGYNAAVTALFVDPDTRYRLMVDLQVLLIAGLGALSIQHWLSFVRNGVLLSCLSGRWSTAVSSIRNQEILARFTAFQLTTFVAGFVFMGFAGWALFMVINTES